MKMNNFFSVAGQWLSLLRAKLKQSKHRYSDGYAENFLDKLNLTVSIRVRAFG